jgi:hypothetical protein
MEIAKEEAAAARLEKKNQRLGMKSPASKKELSASILWNKILSEMIRNKIID